MVSDWEDSFHGQHALRCRNVLMGPLVGTLHPTLVVTQGLPALQTEQNTGLQSAGAHLKSLQLDKLNGTIHDW